MDDAAQEQASHRNMDHGFRDIEGLLFNCIEKASKRKMSAKRREDRVVAAPPMTAGSMDFLSDQPFDERKIRALTVVDNFSRFSPAIDVKLSCRSADAMMPLDGIASPIGSAAWTKPAQQGRRLYSNLRNSWRV